MFFAVIVHYQDTDLSERNSPKIKPGSVVYSEAYHSYDTLDVSEFHHHRINHSDIFVDEKIHINGIENFWNQAKRDLRKYNVIDKKYFHLFLKE